MSLAVNCINIKLPKYYLCFGMLLFLSYYGQLFTLGFIWLKKKFVQNCGNVILRVISHFVWTLIVHACLAFLFLFLHTPKNLKAIGDPVLRDTLHNLRFIMYFIKSRLVSLLTIVSTSRNPPSFLT